MSIWDVYLPATGHSLPPCDGIYYILCSTLAICACLLPHAKSLVSSGLFITAPSSVSCPLLAVNNKRQDIM